MIIALALGLKMLKDRDSEFRKKVRIAEEKGARGKQGKREEHDDNEERLGRLGR